MAKTLGAELRVDLNYTLYAGTPPAHPTPPPLCRARPPLAAAAAFNVRGVGLRQGPATASTAPVEPCRAGAPVEGSQAERVAAPQSVCAGLVRRGASLA